MSKGTRRTLVTAALLAIALVTPAIAQPISSGEIARIKDIVQLQGARPNQVSGMGLVTGLPGTGDSQQMPVTELALINLIQKLDNIPINEIQGQVFSRNVAMVLVTCQLPPFVKPGQQVDVTVSSVGDAQNITNGVLLQVPLKGADGKTYVVAQGPISTGGYEAAANASSFTQNQVLVGRVPNGGIVEREVPVTVVDNTGYLYLNLSNPDFATAARVADAINASGLSLAQALDAATVRCYVTSVYRDRVPDLIARIEQLTVRADHIAKVVIDERTGTVVMGSNTRIDPIAISHGALTIKIKTNTSVSQPPPFSNGQTVVYQNSSVNAKEHPAHTVVFSSGANLGQLIKALNALGVTPRQMISIVQDIKAAGALNAQLEII